MQEFLAYTLNRNFILIGTEIVARDKANVSETGKWNSSIDKAELKRLGQVFNDETWLR